MISKRTLHREKMKLADKFQQPFDAPIGDMVKSFNKKKQKTSTKKRKR